MHPRIHTIKTFGESASGSFGWQLGVRVKTPPSEPVPATCTLSLPNRRGLSPLQGACSGPYRIPSVAATAVSLSNHLGVSLSGCTLALVGPVWPPVVVAATTASSSLPLWSCARKAALVSAVCISSPLPRLHRRCWFFKVGLISAASTLSLLLRPRRHRWPPRWRVRLWRLTSSTCGPVSTVAAVVWRRARVVVDTLCLS